LVPRYSNKNKGFERLPEAAVGWQGKKSENLQRIRERNPQTFPQGSRAGHRG
jgi:hypothetical protein